MQNRCKILIKIGIVAVIASLPISVPAQSGDSRFVSDFTTDSNIPSVLQRDGQTVTTVLNDLIVVVTGAELVAAPSDANMGFFLGGAGSPLDDFSSPDVAIDAINSMTTELVGVDDLSPLGVIRTPEMLSNRVQKSEDLPFLFKLYNSILEMVGIDTQCTNPTEGDATKCDRRIVARQ